MPRKSHTEILVDFALNNWCPGCQQNLAELAEDSDDFINRYCTCCGWYVWGNPQKPQTLSFGSFPTVLDADGEQVKFECAIKFPEHRDCWPKIERDPDQPDEYSQEELEQEIIESNPNHFYILNELTCSLCGQWAPHKVTEGVGVYDRLPLTSQFCCDCFEDIFGPESHQYDKVYEKPKPGEYK